MAADSWKIFDTFKLKMADGTLDMDGDTFKVALFASTYTPLQTDDSYDTVKGGNELATLYGYTVGGATLAATAWTDEGGGAVMFDCDDPFWDASGGDIVCRTAVIYDFTDAGTQLVAYSLLNNTPADVTVTDGNRLTLQMNANGVFRLSGGW